LNTETMWYYCTNGFSCLWAFQWYIICNFWMHGLKDMIFQIFNWNQIRISILNSIWTRSRHVADYYWTVPVRLDNGLGPSDLKRSGRIRSSSIDSPKWICPDRWIKIRQTRFKGRGSSPARVRFPVSFPVRAADS
jgi:hypothetical protein